MRSDDLFKAIGNIADRHIDDRPIEDIPKKKRIPAWIKWVSVAASLALIALVGVNVFLKKTESVAALTYPSVDTSTDELFASDCWADVEYIDYAELAKRAEAVIVADVTETVLEHAEEYDEYTFNCFAKVFVREVIKGNLSVGDSLYVVDNGLVATDLDVTLTYSGGPMMAKGNRVLLFITPNEHRRMDNGDPFYTFTDVYHGAFFYGEDSKYREVTCYSKYFPDHIQARPTYLEDYEPKTLDEIKNLITQDSSLLSDEEIQ